MEIFSYRNLISRLFKLQNVKNGWINMVLKCEMGKKNTFSGEIWQTRPQPGDQDKHQ